MDEPGAANAAGARTVPSRSVDCLTPNSHALCPILATLCSSVVEGPLPDGQIAGSSSVRDYTGATQPTSPGLHPCLTVCCPTVFAGLQTLQSAKDLRIVAGEFSHHVVKAMSSYRCALRGHCFRHSGFLLLELRYVTADMPSPRHTS